jgi:hypothetical protein
VASKGDHSMSEVRLRAIAQIGKISPELEKSKGAERIRKLLLPPVARGKQQLKSRCFNSRSTPHKELARFRL